MTLNVQCNVLVHKLLQPKGW